MADFPLYQGARYLAYGYDAAASRGTLVYSGATIHTKGSWTEICSSIPTGVVGFWLQFDSPDSYRYLLDVGIGSGPTTIVSNFYWYQRQRLSGQKPWFPIALPAGESLKVRIQTGSSSQRYVGVSLIFMQGGLAAPVPLAGTETWGVDGDYTEGNLVDPGATANTKGSWTEMVASTTQPCRAFTLMFGCGSDLYPPNIPYGNMLWLVDVALGSAGNEEPIIENIQMSQDTASDVFNGDSFVGPFDALIPEGSRVSVRAQCNANDATYRLFRLGVLGFF